MPLKERGQNPVVGDDIRLRLFVYNSNNRADVVAVEKVEIYHLDPSAVTDENVEGRRLVETIDGADVTREEDGLFSATFTATGDCYTIGKYRDVWSLQYENNTPVSTVENLFQIYPDLWYTTTMPIVYDFAFAFRPNRIRHGSRRWLHIDVTPNVPRATDLERYYLNLAIASPIKISIERACDDCLPVEQDLRLVIDNESIDLREQCQGFYLLDTEDLDCGVYNVWFEMEFGESKYISDKQQLQIFE